MDALMRMTGAVAALGAALIALAVGAASVPWLAVPLLAAGVGQAAVAVLALRGGRLHDPRLHSAAVLAPLVAPTLAWLGALLAAPEAAAGMPLGPMLAETALALSAAAMLARPSGPIPSQRLSIAHSKAWRARQLGSTCAEASARIVAASRSRSDDPPLPFAAAAVQPAIIAAAVAEPPRGAANWAAPASSGSCRRSD
ncbi:MAG TPA: hypothetical protein VFM87_02960, partial [Agrococcus sp.]|nr:hypothetical protein [Agrococcus sp.]